MPPELILALPFLIAAALGIYFHLRSRREANRRASDRVLRWHEQHRAPIRAHPLEPVNSDEPRPSPKWPVL